ncbi:MAG: aldehyde ferredoxin oxidoreductase [Campylobacteraceae bacterium]|nr:aldehyde ferredoxin oxidoreductase [Campylobacteraceae bacterium]
MSDKIYRVNMSNLSFKIEEVPQTWMGLGGRGLTSTIVSEEVDPECHPLGPNNKMIFAPGLLSGTSAANSGRNSLGAKSPLTGGIKESNVGGTSAGIFAKLGIKALIIEGLTKDDKDFYHLHVTKNHVEFIKVPELIGKDNYFVLNAMMEKYSKKVAVMSIGRPGEMRMLNANISVKDPNGKLRSHGRGGLGAVMGAKKIKCITVDAADYKEVTLADPEKFKIASKMFTKSLKENFSTGQALPRFGTSGMVNIINEAGGLPTRGFRSGNYEFADLISGETIANNIQERGGSTTHGCHAGCVIQCSQVYNDKEGKYLTSGFEYETVWAFGANLGIRDLDLIAKIDALMDDLGVDSIETGVTLGLAVDAGILEYGDGERAYKLIHDDIANGTPLGRILGSGSGNLGKLYGLVRAPVVKNQSMPAYDPRSIKGIGITYATTPMGSDHTAGYAISVNILRLGGYVDPLQKEGQVEMSRNLQIASAFVDSTGMCNLIDAPLLEDPIALPTLADLINARFGTELSVEDVKNMGKKILKTERAFNIKAGLTSASDRLPEFMKYEAIAPHNAIWDFTNEEIDEFWNF